MSPFVYLYVSELWRNIIKMTVETGMIVHVWLQLKVERFMTD